MYKNWELGSEHKRKENNIVYQLCLEQQLTTEIDPNLGSSNVMTAGQFQQYWTMRKLLIGARGGDKAVDEWNKSHGSTTSRHLHTLSSGANPASCLSMIIFDFSTFMFLKPVRYKQGTF